MTAEEVLEVHRSWDNSAPPSLTSGILAILASSVPSTNGQQDVLTSPTTPPHDPFYIILPLLIVLSTFFFLLLLFLVCVIILRRRRGIMLRDHDGPIDMSREDVVEGEGGFEGVESRWLESVNENERRMYHRAKRMFH